MKWGDKWRMPTETEFNELCNKDNCNWERTTINGINGYKVTSKKAGYTNNYVFLPAAGWKYYAFPTCQGQGCEYWSSTPSESQFAYALMGFCMNGAGRFFGYMVRPVASKETSSKTSINTCVFSSEMYAVFDKSTNDWKYTKASTGCVVSDMTGSWSAVAIYTDSKGEQQTLFFLDEITDMTTSEDNLEVTFKGTVPVLNETVHGSIVYKYSKKTLLYSDSKGNKIMMLGAKLVTAF